MIKKIILKNVATYVGDKEEIIDPKKINFLFGLNGSGKTTISRYINKPTDEKYKDCKISWEDSKLKCSVYNRDFVRDNFSETVPGIFTLGESTIETQTKIKSLRDKIEELKKTINNKTKDINNSDTDEGGYTQQLDKLDRKYTEKFWSIKQNLDNEESPIKGALSGYLGNRERFKTKLLEENESNKVELLDKETLEKQTARLFGKNVEKENLITFPNFEEIQSLEDDHILQIVIVGKENVTISGLIKKLGNSSWFSQGRQYLSLSDGKCPYCQQKLPSDFAQQIEDYFDKTYDANIQKVFELTSRYETLAPQLISQIQELIDTHNKFLSNDSLDKEFTLLKIELQKNITKLKEKISFPNTVVTLDSLKQIADSIKSIIDNANSEIKNHNSLIDNIKKEKQKLTFQVWKYLISQLSSDIKDYLVQKAIIENNLNSAKEILEKATTELQKNKNELIEVEKKLTSIIPTAEGINKMLENYGFNNFRLVVNKEDNSYQFVRINNEPAFESLSEGEKNFVTFLYFIQTLKGSMDESGRNEDKVLVIDDPVSSLDNDILFLVSTLIRDLFRNIYNDSDTIKQIFILSHNLYFFKEVSYEKGLTKNKTGYWLITKTNNISKIDPSNKNPVSSTYEMLWDEVIIANKNSPNCNTVTLANVMRRIIEYYFKFLGGEDLNKFHLKFPDGERQIFKSIISWANSGSHSAFDDFLAATATYDVEKYLNVFKDIFEKTGNMAHYKMMMKTKEGE